MRITSKYWTSVTPTFTEHFSLGNISIDFESGTTVYQKNFYPLVDTDPVSKGQFGLFCGGCGLTFMSHAGLQIGVELLKLSSSVGTGGIV